MRDNSWIVGQPYLNLTGLRRVAGYPEENTSPDCRQTVKVDGFRTADDRGSETCPGPRTPPARNRNHLQCLIGRFDCEETDRNFDLEMLPDGFR
jgi:hypothetical protein